MPAEDAIGIRVDVSGVKECQQQMSAAAQSVRTMQSALKLADSEFKVTGDSAAMYTSKVQTLQQQIAAQSQAVEAAQRALKTVSQAYGESSSQAMAWQTKLNTAQTSLNNMTASLKDMQAKLAESTSAMSGTAGAADALSGALAGMAGGSYSMDGLNSSLGATQGEIQKTREQLGDLQEQVKETGGLFYNVGNMSISAANGGKVASAITGIAKEITSLVKSSGQTAENTGGLLNGGMSTGGVMSTVGGIVSNFGPWGAVAGSILDMGGAIIDTITAAEDARKLKTREEAQRVTAGNLDLTKLQEIISQRQEVTATLDADIQAEVTAKVDGLRVIIDEITEDGKVNTREVGSVRKYVQEVLMADYDDAVKDLYRMRGELWKIATQGFTNEEVAMLGVRTGDSEQSALYAFMEQWLTAQGQDAGSWLQEITGRNFDAETLATQMWLHLAKSFGSPEAMTAAMADPETRKQSQDAVAKFLSDEFGMSYEKSQTTAAEFMRSLSQKTAQGFEGANWTTGSDWLTTTAGGGVFSQWVQTVLGADKKAAEEAASEMWIELMASCANPSAAANAVWQSTGEEAAAAYQSGEGSDTANAFGAMVAWVKNTLGLDEQEAVAKAIEMWDNVKKAASYGTSDGSVLTPDTSWIESTEAGTMLTDYVKALLGDENSGDYADALEKAKGMWEAVIAACSSPEAAINAIEGSTGEEAAAAYEAKDNSDKANTFGAMVEWVQATMGLDKQAAIDEAIKLWNQVRLASFLGIDDKGQSHTNPLTPKWTFSGSTAMRDYISARMGTDFETAINKANQYWDDLIKSMNGETSAEENSPLRATLLQQALDDYKGTLEEIDKVTGEMPNLTGSALDAKVKELEALLARAEELAGRVEQLRGEQITQGEGAFNLVTYGTGKYDESDVADAIDYLSTLLDFADQDYANAVADAKKKQREAHARNDATEEELAAADAEYDAAVQAASQRHDQVSKEYAQLYSDLFARMFKDLTGSDSFSGDNPALFGAAMQLLNSGVLSGLDPGSHNNYSGPLADFINYLYSDIPITTWNDSGATVGTSDYRSGYQGVRLDADGYHYGYGNGSSVQPPKSVSEFPLHDYFESLIESGTPIELPLNNLFIFKTDDLDKEGENTGKNLVDSLAASIDANAPTAEAAGTRLGQNVAAAVRAALKIASPSKLMQQYGAFTAEGLAGGIDAGITRVARASGRMAAAVARPVASAAATSGPTYNNTATSSLFVENYYQRSDADIDVLAASIADKNRLTRMGNGLRT